MKNSYAVIVVLFIGLIGCNDTIKEKPASSPQLIREIDKIKLTNMNGQAISLKQYLDKTIFIHFWATWCKPCIQEMPTINEAQNILQNEKIVFLLASNESAQQIEEFSHANKFKFNYVRIENSEEMNVQALPTTFIFNRKGKLVFSETGSRKWDEKSNIDMILKLRNENE